jgi:hypothetical protein
VFFRNVFDLWIYLDIWSLELLEKQVATAYLVCCERDRDVEDQDAANMNVCGGFGTNTYEYYFSRTGLY